ncbi:NADH dehydrogenase subunit J [Roseovarius sp. EC-HK134]|jgi:hypothetical protein|uniref:Uncharacterized protein n=1 Tax=Roseovarius mucosus TaxID=215743 RepID=A0A1V0RIX8_9RHOB|nr:MULTISPECIES: hypothetical protein [Roseovarius]ARE81728.1 hypothetical protein ROSMUCSMR3_00218 [Roseovarius mucosus]AWZ21778.1 Hypothetical protein RAK1035_3070 [Roseovarius sp. AK1035]EDM31971.1 NADH dehydrogenase subunit J [Roseovarius sp. TM1035]VVT31426.1 NADH dehydrogenase subunit J [Roseovarius sp. EC-HK134]VVT31860.1 NADH dehydrogenase subunit J [Roseovarius sp. EC-SD190]|tara:strand:- start:155 stop:289 length:135 start_codon:yes stop_codon:yes gene_type:complete
MADLLHHAVSALGLAGLAAIWSVKMVLGFFILRIMKRRRLRVRG